MAINTTIQVVAPGAGESVTEGEILEWHVKEGDRIEADATIVEISTDKVDVEVPSPASGTVVKLHVAEGDTVTVGQVLAEIQPDGNGGDAPAASGNGDGQGGDARGPEVGDASQIATAGFEPEGDTAHEPADTEADQDTTSDEILDIVTPAGGESVTEAEILEWSVKVGDTVEADQPIVELSTDKVDMELPAPAAGVITEILAGDGDTVTPHQVIARMRVGGDAAGAGTGHEAPATTASSGNGNVSAAPPAASAATPARGTADASPVAARAAAAEGVDLSSITGTGPRGRVMKDDVLGARNGSSNGGGAAAPAATPGPAPVGARPMRGSAAMLARYMDESRAIPTATSFRTITVTTMDARRKELKEAGHKVSFTHLIAYAIALAVQQDMPVMAHHFAEVEGKPHRVDDDAVNLGIAVDVTNKKGERTLMVPVIPDAGRRSFDAFKAAFDELIAKARDNALTADDLQGANISLTNPGGIGTIASVPRLMQGQGTIIATGSIAYPVGLGNIGDMIGAEKVMTMTSTYDHRIIQGAESGQFLKTVEEYLQGDHGFYEGVFHALGAPLGPPPTPPAPAAAAAAARATAAPAVDPSAMPSEEVMQAVQAAVSLVKAHRTHGHLAAKLDPLGSEPEGDPALDPEPLGLTPEVMARIPAKILRMAVPGATLADALPHLRETYCGTIAYEIEHISSHRQRVWLREKIESGSYRTPLTNDEQQALLKRLVEVDAFERFMHKAYLGQKQFSVEGLDMTIPILDELIQLSAAHGAREVVVGMAHRGRLNVLAHNLGRPYETIFAEFEGASTLEAITTIPSGGHRRREVPPRRPGLLPALQRRVDPRQPRVQPVAPRVRRAGRARRHPRRADDPAGPARPSRHERGGPARPARRRGVPGQGVVAETLNLQALDGYQVGGCVHLIQNNQVGFTTDPEDSRSTRWASDLAKGFDVPIIHVNADDVAACISAARLAFRVPPGVRARRPHRPHRLPPLRPQRGRRARVHPAGDVREDQAEESASPSCSPTRSWAPASSRRRTSSASASRSGTS